MFWCTLVFSPTDYILKQKWCIEKDKTPEAVYLLKVSNYDNHGDYWKLFKVKTYDAVFVSLLITLNKCHKIFTNFLHVKCSILFSSTFISNESSFWHWNNVNIRPAHFVNIRFILNNLKLNKWFQGQRDRRLSNFCQIN